MASGWGIVCWLILLTLGHLLAIGATRWQCAASSGNRLHGVTAANKAQTTLRVATFNIHSGRNAQGQQDLERTADSLRGFDLIGLNEVGLTGSWHPHSQAEWLGERLSLPWLFAPSERSFGRQNFGNGLLCNLPVQHWETIPLPSTQERGLRVMLLAQIDFGNSPLNLLVTHIDRRRDRAPQLQQALHKFLSLPAPAILLGDLNTTADDAELARALVRPDVSDALQAGGVPSARRIDWILTRGLKVISAGAIDHGASDHPAYWAELKLAP